MFSIYNGTRRSLETEPSKEIYVRMEVAFRTYLHHFKGARLMVLIALALHMDEEGQCFPSYDTLMKETGLNRTTVAKAVKDLESMTVAGKRVLAVWRERDSRGKFVGSNIYQLFPTVQEIQSWENPTLDDIQRFQRLSAAENIHSTENPTVAKAHSTENPTLGKSNVGKNHPEEKPIRKEKPTVKDIRPAANAAAATRTLIAGIETALRTINNGLAQPFTGVKALAAKLHRRGEAASTVNEAWAACQVAGNPAGAFVLWMQDGYLPSTPAPTRRKKSSDSTLRPATHQPTEEEVAAYLATQTSPLEEWKYE